MEADGAAGFEAITTYEPSTHPELVPDPDARSQTVVWEATITAADAA